MDPLLIPDTLKSFTEGWRLVNASRGGVSSLVGSTQYVVSAASRWEGKFSLHCRKPQHYIDADGFLASLDGQANPFLCGPADWRGRPWNVHPLTGAEITPALAKQSYKADPAFESNPYPTGDLLFLLAQDALMNATTISVERRQGGHLRAGQYFSINNRLHIITALQTPSPAAPGSGLAVPGTVRVSIRPWLRLDYAAGTVMDFARPLGTMRMAEVPAPVERTTSPVSEFSWNVTEYF